MFFPKITDSALIAAEYFAVNFLRTVITVHLETISYIRLRFVTLRNDSLQRVLECTGYEDRYYTLYLP